MINISGGTDTYDSMLDSVIKKAISQGVVIVAAAGNSSKENCDYPAAFPNVLSVGAINRNFEVSDISNFGSKVKIFAPGEEVITTSPVTIKNQSETTIFQGTSAAAPFVSALAAIIKSKSNNLSAMEIINIILCSSKKATSKENQIKIIDFEKTIESIATTFN